MNSDSPGKPSWLWDLASVWCSQLDAIIWREARKRLETLFVKRVLWNGCCFLLLKMRSRSNWQPKAFPSFVYSAYSGVREALLFTSKFKPLLCGVIGACTTAGNIKTIVWELGTATWEFYWRPETFLTLIYPLGFLNWHEKTLILWNLENRFYEPVRFIFFGLYIMEFWTKKIFKYNVFIFHSETNEINIPIIFDIQIRNMKPRR